ncbi:hypothetical protein TA3x_005057 [Tundrisphaera sp. TA3]|uniref:hypothetical protein n=1 Tax=Tundrisphaera sp. TA3 TaxID=3435775 RepID=UPI003EBE3FC6
MDEPDAEGDRPGQDYAEATTAEERPASGREDQFSPEIRRPSHGPVPDQDFGLDPVLNLSPPGDAIGFAPDRRATDGHAQGEQVRVPIDLR